MTNPVKNLQRTAAEYQQMDKKAQENKLLALVLLKM